MQQAYNVITALSRIWFVVFHSKEGKILQDLKWPAQFFSKEGMYNLKVKVGSGLALTPWITIWKQKHIDTSND